MNYSMRKCLLALLCLSSAIPAQASMPRVCPSGKRAIAVIVAVSGVTSVGYWLWQRARNAKALAARLDEIAKNAPVVLPVPPADPCGVPVVPAVEADQPVVPEPVRVEENNDVAVSPELNDGGEPVSDQMLLKPDFYALPGHVQVRSFIAGLYKHAKSKGQVFTEGTFVVEDFDGQLFNWLRQVPGNKPRISTHFAEYPTMKQYGLDVDGLPDGKKTLLFGQFTHAANHKNYIFIKPESHGVHGVVDLVLHTGSLVQAQINKFNPGADDAPEYRKERVPDQVMRSFKAVIDSVEYAGGWYAAMTSNVTALSRVFGYNKHRDGDVRKKGGKTFGIWKMRCILENYRKTYADNKSVMDLIARFDADVANYDNLDVRKGREVIVTTDVVSAIERDMPREADWLTL